MLVVRYAVSQILDLATVFHDRLLFLIVEALRLEFVYRLTVEFHPLALDE